MQTPLKTENRQPKTMATARAWTYLVWLSFQRQARAHLMIWIALGLLAFTFFLVAINTQAGRWSMAYQTWPRGGATSYEKHVEIFTEMATMLPWPAGVMPIADASFRAAIERASGVYMFSNWIVFF